MYCLVDLINGNSLTLANNPVMKHYWLDANGTAYLEDRNCSEMSKGFCVSNGCRSSGEIAYRHAYGECSL